MSMTSLTGGNKLIHSKQIGHHRPTSPKHTRYNNRRLNNNSSRQRSSQFANNHDRNQQDSHLSPPQYKLLPHLPAHQREHKRKSLDNVHAVAIISKMQLSRPVVICMHALGVHIVSTMEGGGSARYVVFQYKHTLKYMRQAESGCMYGL
jgi:hypothetical protein